VRSAQRSPGAAGWWFCCAAAGILLLFTFPVDASAGDRGVRIDGPGRWTLPELGSGPISLDTTKEIDAVHIPIEFPRGAFQPADPSTGALSYIAHLDIQVAVARSSGSGVAIFDAITDGCVGDMINVHVRARKNKPPLLGWNTNDLVRGARGGFDPDGRFELHGSNYVPFCGVAPGPTYLDISVQRIGGLRLDRAVILPSSGLEVTTLHSPELKIKPTLSDEELEAGEHFEISYTIANVGDRPADQTFVELAKTSGPLKTVGGTSRQIGELRDREDGSFKLTALRPGPWEIQIAAGGSNTNEPLAVVKGEFAPRGSKSSFRFPSLWLCILWGAAVIGGGLLLLQMRRGSRMDE
jgi:hypothetical protein